MTAAEAPGSAATARSGSTWAVRVAGWALIGAIDEVTASPGFGGEFQGHGTVDVRWRTLSGWHVAQVVEQHPLRRVRINGLPVVYDLGEDLRALDAGLEVDRREHWRERTSDAELLGWRLPGWTALVVFGVWIGALMLVVGGAPPWRATRWAWFWLLALAAPVGVVAFLLLGGPCGLLPPAPGRKPGLRGGWGLLLALLIGSAIGTVGS